MHLIRKHVDAPTFPASLTHAPTMQELASVRRFLDGLCSGSNNDSAPAAPLLRLIRQVDISPDSMFILLDRNTFAACLSMGSERIRDYWDALRLIAVWFRRSPSEERGSPLSRTTRTKTAAGRLKPFDELCKVGEGTGQPVDLVDHDLVDETCVDVGEQALQARALQGSSRDSSVFVDGWQRHPALRFLARDIRGAGFSLRIEGVELLFETLFCTLSRIDGTAAFQQPLRYALDASTP